MEKEEFKQKAKQTIDDIFAKIDELQIKMDKAKAETKVKYKNEIEELKKKKAELQTRYDKLEDVVEDKWEDVKKAFSESAGSFKEGFSRLGKIFKKDDDKGSVK
jgi:chromosome segregation ATPase